MPERLWSPVRTWAPHDRAVNATLPRARSAGRDWGRGAPAIVRRSHGRDRSHRAGSARHREDDTVLRPPSGRRVRRPRQSVAAGHPARCRPTAVRRRAKGFQPLGDRADPTPLRYRLRRLPEWRSRVVAGRARFRFRAIPMQSPATGRDGRECGQCFPGRLSDRVLQCAKTACRSASAHEAVCAIAMRGHWLHSAPRAIRAQLLRPLLLARAEVPAGRNAQSRNSEAQ